MLRRFTIGYSEGCIVQEKQAGIHFGQVKSMDYNCAT